MKNDVDGRSMVEMLGVLAVVGVLSLGALAGYSKAMLMNKLNIQSEQLSTIFNNSMILLDKFDNTTSSTTLNEIFKNMHIVPENMIDSSGQISDVFHNKIEVGISGSTAYSYMHLDVILPKFNTLQCINLLKVAQRHHALLWKIGFPGINEDSSSFYKELAYGDYWTRTPQLKDLTIEKITEYCQVYNGKMKRFRFQWNYTAR